MNIFWITGFVPTELSSIFCSEKIVSGGWVKGMLDSIAGNDDVILTLVFKTKLKETKSGYYQEGRYYYIGIPDKSFSAEIGTVLLQNRPDVIHLWGTEFPITFETLVAVEKTDLSKRTVLSLQGLTSEIFQYVTVGLPMKVQRGVTLYEHLRHCSLSQMEKSYKKRGEREIACLKKSAVILGRTIWDYACVAKHKCEKKYKICNESFRPSFYQNAWSYEKCEKHSIFISRGDTPIKGIHRMLPALAILAEQYPDVKLYVAGEDPTYKNDFFRRYLKRTKYADYVKKQIRTFDLDNRVVFLGDLTEEEMLKAYMRANVFALTSTIENSPNSLGEAMILGMPCVAADVGGVVSMMTHNKEGFVFQGDSPAMLAYWISVFFDNPELAVSMGNAAKDRAKVTHDPQKNANMLMDIYRSI